MKKYVLFIAILLAALFVLNGCTLFTAYKMSENIIAEDKEAFAVAETQEGNVKNPDDVSAVEDESEETALLAGLPHEYTIESDEGEVLAPDGEVLATYSYSYPVFMSNEGDDEAYVASINQMLKENALDFASITKSEYESLVFEYEDSKEYEYEYRPYDYVYNYGIHLDAKGVISITETWYVYTGGVHGNAAKESHTFDVINGKKLSLSDLLYGTDEEITEAFTLEFLKVSDEFYPGNGPSAIVPEELPNAQYYVDSHGVTAYFQQYQVGPYAAGFVSATISDKEMLKYDFSDVTVE